MCGRFDERAAAASAADTLQDYFIEKSWKIPVNNKKYTAKLVF